MIEADLDIRRLGSAYCRVTIRDFNGRRAWSNPHLAHRVMTLD
ncbi:MAG: hypothetical protein U0521_29925 [Anaerolineae bacterium]